MQPLTAEDPQVIGAYRLLGRLGAGGMGRVYLGRSAGGRTVAVKAVHPHFALDEQFRARFRREVESARKVGGAWTAPVLDADPDAAVPWVATGYVAGPSLTQAVAEVGPLPEETVRTLGAGLAEALAAVHALGLVHRDVKPSNVLLALDGPRLIDFGIARATDGTASLTTTGVSVGSPGYMAPEQILGKGVTGAADVFSLGAVLAYAATGEPPFTGDSSAALLYKVVHEEPVLGAGLRGELRELVARCLSKAPEDRPGPPEVARRLAPAAGASGLVRSGWLPVPLVERVSRQAVELLDLEAESADAVAGAAGRFGPPPGAYGVYGPGATQPSHPPRPPGKPAGRERRWPKQRSARAAEPAADAPQGGRSVSLAATAGGVERRKVSCSLVLTVTGVLAAGLLTASFFTGLLPGTGDEGGGRDAASPPRSSPKGSAETRSEVPKDFLGTWTGQVIQADGVPNGTVTSTITAGGKGSYVVRATYSVLGVMECRAKARLVTATADRITLEEVTDGDRQALCTGEKATVTYTLTEGGRLAYTSDDAKGGRPTATLTRTGG
ncbi:serine/threonine-protein kinase [Streptomyces griseocarneus]|uniref:serine/threonine-protein kinase n=1 Tax=Streptomyces griseocarneus TaxID=51201 RepID=UPI00167CD41C|nr:serine/threonine-protein kinase [Streptomyces griseocarneus]MBZ6477366.1 serine/threonine protein kinase [Streptomyces griseocarneus]GHG75960.1 serine/threonine protein kinase [Streptomyces griseocarneus]